jgi:hypothetical protein
VRGNREGVGFYVSGGTGVRLKANTASVNGTGFEIHGGAGLTLEQNVAGSAFSQSGHLQDGNGTGMLVTDGATQTTVVGNVVNANHPLDVPGSAPIGMGAGIVIDPSATATTVTANGVNRNAGDGIAALGNGGSVTSNTSRYNGGFGIVLGSLMLDGGGNHAAGNAQGQCLGAIVCAP